jgi:hypothetical protein
LAARCELNDPVFRDRVTQAAMVRIPWGRLWVATS